MGVQEIVKNILMGIFSNILKSINKNCIETYKFKKFMKRVDSELRKIINKNDGTVLTTGTFEKFLQNYHPIEKMFLNISGKKYNLSKMQFIKEQNDLFFNNYSNLKEKPLDRVAFNDFFMTIYDFIEDYYKKRLSKNEGYIAGIVEKIQHNLSIDMDKMKKDIIKIVEEESKDLKNILLKLDGINDPDIEWSLYVYFSKKILNGSAMEVFTLYPILPRISKDLELGVEFLLNYFSSIHLKNVDFSIIQKNISSENIYSDLSQKYIYISLLYNDLDLLNSINTRNSVIHDIKCNILNENNGAFFTLHKERKEGVFNIEYELKNNYPEFEWIVKKICMFSILKQNVRNAANYLESILYEEDFLIDHVLLIERKIQEYNPNSDLNLKNAKSIISEIESIFDKIKNIPKDIQIKFYCSYIRIALHISDKKAKEVAELVPLEFKKNNQIEMLCMQVQINYEDVGVQSVIDLCMKNNQYWLFNNYLGQIVIEKPKEAKKLIERYLFTIDKDVAIFLIYAQLVYHIDGDDKSRELFDNYQSIYGMYIEYWIEKLRIQYSNEELTYLVHRWSNGELLCLFYESDLDIINMLIEHNRYKDAFDCIHLIEKTSDLQNDYLRVKAKILLNINHEIEALMIYKKLFETGVRDVEILYYILAISLSNKRKVESDIIEYAKAIENSNILEVLPFCEEINGNIESANELILKSLLRTRDKASRIFGYYLGFQVKREILDVKKNVCVAEDTTTHCINEQGKEKVICIHSKKILPNEPYYWEDAEHIYKDTAIQRNLLRRKIGDLIELSDGVYKINQIESLDKFLFRVSTNHLIDRGDIKVITIPTSEVGEIEIKSFEKIVKTYLKDDSSKLKWIDFYKNMNEPPLSLSFYKKFTRATYTQFIDSIIEEKSIPFREIYGQVKESDRYILTAAAVVVLKKINFYPEKTNKEIIISTTLQNVVEDDTSKIINEYDRECVSSMGIIEDKIYVNEETEEAKQDYMKRAVELKKYVSKYKLKENVFDLEWKDSRLNIKEFMGISDYDATCIAQKESYTLVTAEISYNILASQDSIKVNTICIADFLNDMCLNVDNLLNYIKLLLEYRFVIPFTDAVVIRLANEYDGVNDLKQQNILQQWRYILNVPLQDNTYKRIMAKICSEIIEQTKGYIRQDNPILIELYYTTIQYLGCSIEIEHKNGKLISKLVENEEKINGNSQRVNYR